MRPRLSTRRTIPVAFIVFLPFKRFYRYCLQKLGIYAGKEAHRKENAGLSPRQSTGNHTQTVKRAADNKYRLSTRHWKSARRSACFAVRGFQGACPRRMALRSKVKCCYTLRRRCYENAAAAGKGQGSQSLRVPVHPLSDFGALLLSKSKWAGSGHPPQAWKSAVALYCSIYHLL